MRRFTTACVAATLLLLVMVPAASGSRWTIQRVASPSVTRSSGQLSAVSCASATDCTAVGSAVGANEISGAIVEHWNGGGVSLQPTPDPRRRTFNGVSCPSVTDCTAVGSSADGNPLIEHWNGISWSLQSTTDLTPASVLAGVSCTSATTCTAVGYSFGRGAGVATTLAARWNGTSWSLQRTIDPTTNSRLTSVSCTSPTACVAAGSYFYGSTAVTLAEAWDGTSWSVQVTANPTAVSDSFNAVSCTSATACTAVGTSELPGSSNTSKPLVERWDGAAWSVQTAAAASGELSGVACTAATACTAVGATNDSMGMAVTSAEVWTGAAWSVQPTPSPILDANAYGSALRSVSCTSPAMCGTVGSSDNNGYMTPLAERFDAGGWANQPTADITITTTLPGLLDGASCAARTECTAVGSAGDASLAERWNGTAWTVQGTAEPALASNSNLSAVSCVSATACTAVGFAKIDSHDQETLAERWNGTAWTIQRTPNPQGYSTLLAVSCPSATTCTAVGFSGDPGGGTTTALAERWTGTRWNVQPVRGVDFNSVSCVSARRCTAVGDGFNGALAEVWNGHRWTVQRMPKTPASGSLLGVSCTSAIACTAVGYTSARTGRQTALAEHWDGISWSRQRIPQAKNGYLIGVSCKSAACTAVGVRYRRDGRRSALIERFDGSRWGAQRTQHPGGIELSSVSCDSARSCTAVGSDKSRLIAERYS